MWSQHKLSSCVHVHLLRMVLYLALVVPSISMALYKGLCGVMD